MMKRKMMMVILAGLVLFVGGIASAALAAVSFDREIASGRVMVDLSAEVAIQFVPGTGYEDFLILKANGEVFFDLTRGLKPDAPGTGGFNPDSRFFLGGRDDPLFTLVNHSDLPVTLALTAVSGGLSLEGESLRVEPGEAGGFYFGIDTTEMALGTAIQASLTVDSDPGEEGGMPVQSGTSFFEVSAGLIDLVADLFAENASYGRDWGDYRYLDIGLDPGDWEAPVGHLYYKPAGNLLRVSPEEGYVIEVMDFTGERRSLTAALNYDILYDHEGDQWYYHSVAEDNRIDISSFELHRQ